MTRKDFELIARAMHESKPLDYENEMTSQWEWTLMRLIEMGKGVNPAFNADKFTTYCNKGAYK